MQGTVEAGVFLSPGESATGIMRPGDLGFAPRGSGHYLRNLGTDFAHVVLIFNSGHFTNVDLNNFLGVSPPSWVGASLGISTADAKEINYELPGFAPSLKPQAQRPGASSGRVQGARPQQASTARVMSRTHA
jgi:oxalate decarboxylase